ncbi:hypothetical protein [Natronorubrum sp. FCH18a]|uniref:hypothetical protein n=1 Tax=Natronorubrum sp. FCH18a TaxID=3447018 RepID=UPI003F5199FB
MSLIDHPTEPRSTPSSTADAAESKWMLRKGFGLAVTSIVGLLVLMVGLEVLSGLVVVPSGVQLALGIWLGGLAFVLILLTLPAEDDGERNEKRRAN